MAPVLDQTPQDTPRDTPDITRPQRSNDEPSISIKHAAENTNVTKRLQTELMNMMLSSPPGISAFPDSDSNLQHWTATISGPSGTPYENMTFRLSFEFPSNYPYVAPIVLFKTPIYHPNIDFSGRICLDILKEKWSAIYNVQSVLLSLQSLLGEPNNASPLNGEAAELWDNDQATYRRKVLERHEEPSDKAMS